VLFNNKTHFKKLLKMLNCNIGAWYITEVAGNAVIVYKEISTFGLVKKLA
jgi:hypothetical protein